MTGRRGVKSPQRWIQLATAFFALGSQSGLPPITVSPPPGLPSNTIDLGLDRPTGTYSIRLPANVQAESCHLEHLQAGAFGGISGFVTPKIQGNTLTLATGAQSKPAQRLKAMVWCPGYAVALINEQALEQSVGKIELVLRPLANVEINAKVLSGTGTGNLSGDEVRVLYVADWVCGFFGFSECFGPPSWMVATATIGNEGALRFAVPNFAADPSVMAHSYAGGFRLHVSGSYSLEADPPAGGGRYRTIPVSSNYPSIITLRPQAR
jgi:hypothetical protein